MRKKYSHRYRRLWASGSPVLLGGGAAMITALGTVTIAYFTHQSEGTTAVSLNPPVFWGLLVGAIVGLGALAMQWMSEYRKRTYDPTWALKFDALFCSLEMKEMRSRAAEVLQNKSSMLRDSSFMSPEIDDILDFFEDLGFYMQGDQITPEVTHHAFFYWIHGYYSAARDYIETAQRTSPSAWEFLRDLFETTYEIEEERSKGNCKQFLDASELTRFLSGEIERKSDKHAKIR